MFSILNILIPVINEILDNTKYINFMSTLHLTSRHFQIEMNPDDIATTAFITRNGCFALKRVNFDLSGEPSTLQKAMNTTFIM